MSAEMPVVQGAVVAPGQVQPGIVTATVLQPVAVVIPQGAVVGTVVAVQGPGGPQNLAVPIGYKPGMTWNVAFPPAGHGQSLGLNGMAQLLGGADRIEINQKVNRLEAASCGCYEQKNRFEVKIGDKDGPVVMTGQEESDAAAGGCTPTLDISEPGDGSVPHAQVTGPTCFGGCSELCCENH
ncbi:hypothetical protein JL722_15043 [Aureococcus anophagefferens]|nr:hypothetical protein JL722_15043 [Aureococcus anophagefferens]